MRIPQIDATRCLRTNAPATILEGRENSPSSLHVRIGRMNHQALSSFIWSVADLLRGDYRQSEYGKVILPFTVLRRLDCVLEATKSAVLAEFVD